MTSISKRLTLRIMMVVLAMMAFVGDTEQSDDLTMLAIQRKK